MDQRTGQCLCGAVKVKVTVTTPEIQACHCVQCQRWTGGGPYLSIGIDELSISGEDNITIYRASEWAERANCATCGSILFWRMQGQAANSITVGLLDDQSGLKISEEIFTDHRPKWLPPVVGASQSSEAEQKEKLRAYIEGQK